MKKRILEKLQNKDFRLEIYKKLLKVFEEGETAGFCYEFKCILKTGYIMSEEDAVDIAYPKDGIENMLVELKKYKPENERMWWFPICPSCKDNKRIDILKQIIKEMDHE